MNTPQTPEDTQPSHPKHIPIHRRLGFWVILLVVVVALGYYWNHRSSTDTKANGRQGQKVSVILAKVKTQDVPVYITALGNVTPTYTVTVLTQINGTLMQVLFKEGQMVKAGDVLAQIDARPYQALLDQYQGDLLRDQATLTNAYVDLHRYELLYKTHAVSQQTLATQQSLVKQLQGTVQLDQGQIETAKINIAYCRITSPVSGRVGLRLVDPGNYVQTNSTTGIAVVNTLDPITVIFTINEDSIPQVRQRIYNGEKFTVQAYNREQTKLLATGSLITIDNQIDPNTGTVKLRAQFKNSDYSLFPSQFVNAKLLVNTLKNAVVVPTAAIQYSSTGSYTFVVNSDNKTVKEQPLEVGITTGDITTVTKGLTPGQSVVVQGADNLTDGATITISPPNQKNKQHSSSTPMTLTSMLRRFFA